jgi:hypothetical protein
MQAVAQGQVAGQIAAPGIAEGLPAAGGTASPEIERAMALKQQIVKNVQSAPQDASRLVQNWMHGA